MISPENRQEKDIISFTYVLFIGTIMPIKNSIKPINNNIIFSIFILISLCILLYVILTCAILYFLNLNIYSILFWIIYLPIAFFISLFIDELYDRDNDKKYNNR